MISALLEIREGNIRESVNLFLQSFLEKKLLDAILVLVELPSKGSAALALVKSPEILREACPLAPVMPVSMARIVSQLTRVAPSGGKIGVVLRPCELRTLIELVKLKQASLQNLVLIGMDCFGTYSVTEYGRFCQETSTPVEEFLARAGNGSDSRLREACQVCEYPIPSNADLVIGLVGMDMQKQALIQATSSEGERLLEALELPQGVAKGRETAIFELKEKRVKKRDELFEQVRKEVTGLESLASFLASCTNCHNCRVACPICYCKECFFDSSTFEWEGDKYFSQAERKGALRMPPDTLFYHLGRLTHVSLSCVGCGLCQEACPNDIPLARIARFVAAKVQEVFDYVPGQSFEEELPLTIFRETELPWVAEE